MCNAPSNERTHIKGIYSEQLIPGTCLSAHVHYMLRLLRFPHVQVQARIRDLSPQTAVESPELAAMGMRVELDKATGKMAVVKIQ